MCETVKKVSIMNNPKILAQLYDAHHQRHLEDIPFWLTLAQRADDPVLELGCGTGRVLLTLREAGFSVFGLDRDANMLAVLKEKSPNPRQSPPVFLADMSAYHLNHRFGLVILPCNTLSTLEDTTRLRMFDLAAEHLSRGGFFATSLPNPRLLSSLPKHAELEFEESFTLAVDGSTVEVSSAWEHDDQMFKLYWQYDLSTPSGKHERVTATSTHKLLPAAQYAAELEAAGLSIVEQYGDFNLRPFTRRSRSLIILAQKPGR